MSPRKRDRNIESETSYLRIPDTTKHPSPDGVSDYTIVLLNTDQTRKREIDRIAQMARERVYRKNLLLLRKERNLLNAVQYEQLGKIDIAVACYERAANLSERLGLFRESKLYRDKVKSLGKTKRRIEGPRSRRRQKYGSTQYSIQDLESKSILPKGVTIPIVDKETAEKFKESRLETEDEDEDLF